MPFSTSVVTDQIEAFLSRDAPAMSSVAALVILLAKLVMVMRVAAIAAVVAPGLIAAVAAGLVLGVAWRMLG